MTAESTDNLTDLHAAAEPAAETPASDAGPIEPDVTPEKDSTDPAAEAADEPAEPMDEEGGPDADQAEPGESEMGESSPADESDMDQIQDEEGESGEVTVESVIEAVLFASDEPLTAERLVGVLETGSVKQVRRAVGRLNRQYKQQGRAFRIEQIAGGYQMMTLPAYNPWIRRLLRARTDTKLSPAALETLAIVAYKQPVIRADIEAIRGVACGEVLRNLMYKGLVKMVGRAEVLGRPMLYGTTRKFLDTFGLSSLKDLPKTEDLKAPEA